jgi:spore coat protein U-like protein
MRIASSALVLAAIALLVLPSSARADRCKIDVAGTIAFGVYSPLSATPLDVMGSIGYSCSATPGPVISFSRGYSSTFSPRTMLQGGSTLEYNVYLDAARTQIFGDGTAGTFTLNAANQRWQTVPLYGRIFPNQVVPTGSYSDNLVATLNF